MSRTKRMKRDGFETILPLMLRDLFTLSIEGIRKSDLTDDDKTRFIKAECDRFGIDFNEIIKNTTWNEKSS